MSAGKKTSCWWRPPSFLLKLGVSALCGIVVACVLRFWFVDYCGGPKHELNLGIWKPDLSGHPCHARLIISVACGVVVFPIIFRLLGCIKDSPPPPSTVEPTQAAPTVIVNIGKLPSSEDPKGGEREGSAVFLSKLPSSPGELFGRENELALLDRAWENPHTHILMLSAWGGVGKSALVNHWLGHAERDNYRGAERVYGWSFYSQGTSEDRQASADEFLAHALDSFGDPDPAKGAPWEKGVRLAGLIRQERTLLILDGLEPLQYPPGVMDGRLRDQGMQALLKELARAGSNWGLCIISTRLPVPELEEMKNESVEHKPLDNLSDEAGAQLLRSLGVTKGTDKELMEASEDFKGHALALTLLGRYLAVVHDGEIRKRDLVPALQDEESQGGHAARVMKSYEIWLKGKPELDILHLLGLFDRPAEGGAIEVLRREPAIDGLTNSLVDLPDAKWKYALEHLRDLRLLDPKEDACPDTLDCHPLVREHFGAALKAESPEAWKEAHSRLYEYYKDLPEKNLPETLGEMEPLFRAVAHGCQAGRHQETLDEVYWPRIRRGGEAYSVKILGAFGADLAAMSGFFEVLWGQPVDTVTESFRAALLNWAGFRLRALGRLREAREPMQAGLDMCIQQEDLREANRDAGNLSELLLTLGEVNEAVTSARQSVEFADKSGDKFQMMAMRTALADALHQSGDVSAAKDLFEEAEGMQRERQPEYPLLYSVPGFWFCDLLLSGSGYQEVGERAKNALDIVLGGSRNLLDIALSTLSLGRAALLQAQAEGPAVLPEAERCLNQAVQGLRDAGQHQELPRGLLARAELHRFKKDWPAAWRDLDEACEIAERGEMRLHLADYHLEAARLSLAEGNKDKAREHFTTAKQMVEEMGYGRRTPEIDELAKQLGA
jgi:tetratricopeptide (TPR) repeat protein